MRTYYWESEKKCGRFTAENDSEALRRMEQRPVKRSDPLLCLYTEDENGDFRMIREWK
jgi:hypothetical protein